MSLGSGRSASGAEPWPRDVAGAAPLPPDRLSLVVGRALGTVVVTVHGELDLVGGELLEGMLTDLIEGQGNLTVAVDLAEAIVEPQAHTVFIAAARRARRHGAKFVLKEPPSETHQALQSVGLANLVEILPRTRRGPAPGAIPKGPT